MQVESLVAAVGGVSAMFLLPCLFALLLLDMARAEQTLCAVLCGVSLALTGLGVYASVEQLVMGKGGE